MDIFKFIGVVVVVMFYLALLAWWIYILVKKAVKDGILESQPWALYDAKGVKQKVTLESEIPAQSNAGSATK